MAGRDPGLALRCAIGLLALAAYGAGASWVVRREATAYRAALGPEAPPTAVAVAPPVVATPVPVVEPLPPVAVAAPPPVEVAKPAPPAVAEAPPRPAPIIDPIWNDPGVTKVWDLDAMTAEDEEALGEALDRLILTLNQESKGGPSAARVADAARPLRALAGRKDVSYSFKILNSPERNVFSIPGGTIYVTEGLLLSIGEDEEHALQFVLAHEMAHVEGRHALQCLRVPKLKQLAGVGTAEILYRYVIPNAYFDGHDYEADRVALERMKALGYGRYESLAYLRKLERYATDQHFAQGRMAPDLSADRSLVDNHVRAHVSVRDRLARAKAILDSGAPPAPTR